MKKIILLIVILNFTLQLSSKETLDNNTKISNYGLYGSYNIIQNLADFKSFPNYKSCCSSFGNVMSSGYSAGLLYNTELISGMDLQLRLGINSFSSQFAAKEYIGNGYDANLNTVNIYSNHEANTKITKFEFAPTFVQKDILPGFNLLFGFGLGYILNGNFTQTEKLETPNSSINYLNSSSSKEWINYQNKTIDKTKIQADINLGLNYDIITSMFLISPEVKYHYSLSTIAEDVNWKANEIRLGLAIRYITHKEVVVPPPVVVVPPPPKPRPIIVSEIEGKGLDKDGKEYDLAKYVVEEFLSRQIYPLLTYVFFEENSAQLPPRYISLNQNETNSFDENKRFYNSTSMDAYYNLLNIVGKRMTMNPNSKVRLVGCNSNKGVEKDNLNLSAKRAETVKNFLVNRWNVNPNNISIESRNLSANFSRGDLKEHSEENRRVEIYSDDFEIIKPVLVYDTLRLSTPPKVKFKAKAKSEQGITDWQLKVYQIQESKPQEFISLSGVNNLDTTFNWQLRKKTPLPNNENDLIYKLEASQRNADFDSTVSVSGKIPVELVTIQKKRQKRIKDKYVDEYRLIMFDHNSSNVSDLNKKIIELVCKNITPESEIKINGVTDYLGSEKGNLELSEGRANSIKNNINCKAKSLTSVGLGHQELFEENTPEGRFYCRTVEITVETPITE